MNLKTISLCMLGIIMMLASLWIGTWAMYEFVGTWALYPAMLTSMLVFSAGVTIVGATVSEPDYW